MSCDDCSKKESNNKISIFFQNNKNIKTPNCKSCDTSCQPNNLYCILCANRLGLCQKCGKKIFDSSFYKYSDLTFKDYLRKRRAKKISHEINDRLIKKFNLDKLRPKKEKKKKKSPIKIKVTNYNLDKNADNIIPLDENQIESKQINDKDIKKDEDEIKFYDE